MAYYFYKPEDVDKYCEELFWNFVFSGSTVEKMRKARAAAIAKMADMIRNHKDFAYNTDADKVLDDILGKGETDLAAVVDKYDLDIYYGFFK